MRYADFLNNSLVEAFPSGPPLDLMNLSDYKIPTTPFFEERR